MVGIAGDRNGFKNAITSGVIDLMSRGVGADQVFGFAVDVGADSFLHQAEVKC